jgi:hypothetical protein
MALDDLLNAAAGRWNSSHYQLGDLPKNRKIGDEITRLICGEMIQGQPMIFEGQTYVNSDGTASEFRWYHRFGGTVYVEGVLSTTSFNVILTGSDKAIHDTLPNTTDLDFSRFMAFREDVRANASAMGAINLWSKSATSAPTDEFYPAPPWSQLTVQNLFAVVFRSIEKNFSEVAAPPNNVRIISACGRKSSTVETAEPWPLCPIKMQGPTLNRPIN